MNFDIAIIGGGPADWDVIWVMQDGQIIEQGGALLVTQLPKGQGQTD